MGESVVNIKIEKNNPNVLITKIEKGIVSKKHISIENLTSAIVNSYSYSTGILPKGTRFFSGSSNDYSILIETSPMVKMCELDKVGKLNIKLPFPHCLFYFKVRNEMLMGSYLFCLKNTLIKNTDILYKFPYGNVYRNSGKICWGGVKVPKINSKYDTISLISLFFDSKFNAELIDNDYLQNNSYLDFFNNLSKFDNFPLKRLVKVFPIKKVCDLLLLGDKNE